MQVIVGGIVGLVAIAIAVALIVVLFIPILKAVAWFFEHLFKFIYGVITDTLRFVGAIFTTLFFIPLVIGTIVVGRWSASAHYGRAIQGELRTMVVSLYRVAIGHPARLLCLGHLTEGIEKRVPQAVAAAPGPDAPSKRTGQFEGYKIVGSLPGGGSGGKLYVASPDAARLASFARQGQADVQQVVIKTFSLRDGSSLPQIVREGRALDAARKLGLVLDHELTDERFYYVMRYVPGQPLPAVTQSLHTVGDEQGLKTPGLRTGLSLLADLLRTLDTYHRGGLWHKDVKPDNIIVDGNRAHLVDFGLVTPLRSAMTLTTHGTEYFRDPEMVRLALRGVKVHQVDGAKFDIYGAGAVLYSIIENNFPAHGVLSRVSKRCPDAVRWICQRAMTDYDKRYTSAAEMLADIEVVRLAADPMAVRPVDLPSFRAAMSKLDSGEAGAPLEAPVAAAAVAAVVPPPLPRFEPAGAGAPGFVPSPIAPEPPVAVAARFTTPPMDTGVSEFARSGRPKAAAQLASARARMQAARARAAQRRAPRGKSTPAGSPGGVNFGVAVALFMLVFAGVFAVLFSVRNRASHLNAVQVDPDVAVFAQDSGDGQALRLRFPGVADTVAFDAPVDQASVTEAVLDASDTRSRTRLALSDGYFPLDAVPEGYQQAMLDTACDQIAELFEGKLNGRTHPVVLTVRDLPGVALPRANQIASEAGSLLRQSGLDLVGDLASATDEAAATRNIDLVASAHFARGQTPIDSDEFSSRLSNWLENSGEPVDFIVWIGTIRVGERDFEPVLTVVGPRDESIRGEVRKVIRKVLSGLPCE